MGQSSKQMQPRDRRASLVRANAPIAAQYEDCLQSCEQLCSAMQTNTSTWGEWYEIAEDDLERLRLWGDSTGASSRTINTALDHTLRASSMLKTNALRLLTDLNDGLQQGKSSTY
jgi:hypothetical protein